MRPLEHGDPRTIGRHRILARIGVGGMAIVYFGRSLGGRTVAVKVMHLEFAADPEYRDRFLREVAAARTAGGRYSPGVVDADPDAPVPWLAMEFLPAVSLREAVRDHGPLPRESVAPLAAGLAEALASIHGAGILHLDLKPGNVLLTAEGPRVIDFGIVGGVRTGAGAHRAGSPGFMSSEQLAGAATGPASDVFSYGATLAYALTGTPRLDAAGDPLRALVARCLDADPAARPAVTELVSATRIAASDGMSDGMSLPAEVVAEIHRRVSEAANPPVAGPAAPPPTPRVSRRAVLLAGGAAVLGGGATAALAFARDEPVSGRALPGTTTVRTTTTTTAPVAPITESDDRTLEIIVSGESTLYSLTTTVRGQAESVRNVALPWRRIVDIPAWPEPVAWRIDYHHSAGSFGYEIIVDGQTYASGGEDSTGQDVTDFAEGTV
ncbi:MAG: protein kinase [Actinophytocola sp.]|uniref:serine/threonine-protein kinase n=1 Tax=Actinophytocola sp. TaxID=1872138 RepID=UPI00132802FB|nr:serine/threonine-protein kinase [Actinophytocola sp.]MPZ81693.1 protein kinase [Actinophytocola sp.]